MTAGGYLDSPWPGEDAGPARLQAPRGGAGLSLRPGDTLRCVTRNTWMSTMTVLGAPGEVYLLTHSVLRAKFGLPTTSRVEQIDPVTLKTLRRSPRLPGGPMWPGGMAIHRNGDLYVVYGRWAHRLGRDCVPLASLRLPIDQPYNSFVILDNGLIVTKNLSDRTRARLTVIDPDTLQPACPDRDCPEPSIARLSASGNTVYVVGVRSIFRYHWDAAAHALVFDDDWRFDYIGSTTQTYGWDVVLDGQQRLVHGQRPAQLCRQDDRLGPQPHAEPADPGVADRCARPPDAGHQRHDGGQYHQPAPGRPAAPHRARLRFGQPLPARLAL